VARALRGAGLAVVPPGDPVPADIDVHVFVETLNTDDLAALRSAVRPTVAVLNKADLSGFRGDGPMMAATRRCRELHRAFAMPARPLSALLAVAATDPAVLDAELFDALRTLVTAPTAVSDTARLRLASSLDLFGTACAMSAVRAGAGRGGVSALLRAVSGIDEVCDEIDRAGAVVRYRRLTADSGFGDDAVLTRMAAAAEVVRAAGAADLDCACRSDHLRRAVHWQRYAHGPVSALHRACAMDIARGALRLWARADGGPR
jgi:hypothetical protein